MTHRSLLRSAFGPCVLALVPTACSAASAGSSDAAPPDASAAMQADGSADSSTVLDARRGGDAPAGTGPAPGGDASITGADGSVTGNHDAASVSPSDAASVSPSDAASVSPSDAASVSPSDAASLAGWKLTWSDEFNGPDGSAVDPTKWKHDVNGNGWGNSELEYYTDGTQNAVVQGGYLVVTATKQGASQYNCWYGACQYTSARLLTQGLFSQRYGRFEARAQMPTGKGLWPAIWALGDNIAAVGWPVCGEIDFMETIGTDISTNHGSLHMPSNYGPSGTYKLANGASFADGFHTFAIEWEPGTIRFYVDDQLYETQNMASVPGGDTWEFEHPFFLLVNVAVGGQWPGSPDSTTTFPQTMKVDYVRVYQKDGTEP